MKNKLRAILALSLGLSMVAGAQRTVAKKPDSLLKQEQRQERIGKSTGESATLLAELVDEFARNGLAGTDVEILNGMQSVLGKISAELMPEIVTQLKAR